MPTMFVCLVVATLLLSSCWASQDPLVLPPRLVATPAFGWETLGRMTFAHVTKTQPFNKTDLELLKHYPIVQFDKAQDLVSMPYATQEDRFIAAAKQVKQANPRAKLLYYLNGMINFPNFQRLYNHTQSEPTLLLKNTAGNSVQLVRYGPAGRWLDTFDMRSEAMRRLFVADAVYGVSSGAFDGVFIDRANFATRVLAYLVNGTVGQKKNTLAAGWDVPTARTFIPAQTTLFQELTAALGQEHIVLAKESAGYTDWAVANAAMTTDTFCSRYAPRPPPPPPTGSQCGGAAWSVPILGHTSNQMSHTVTNVSTFGRCEEACCERGPTCQSVLYNTQIDTCWLYNEPYATETFRCIQCRGNVTSGTCCGDEWIANKVAPGLPPCCNTTSEPAKPGGAEWDLDQCLADMHAVADYAARGQLTESHGQGPFESKKQREFTMACFLIAAGNYSYFSYASWDMGGVHGAWSLGGTKWWPEYNMPLGQPVDPPLMSAGAPRKFSRRFASGTVVDLDLETHTASISWARREL